MVSLFFLDFYFQIKQNAQYYKKKYPPKRRVFYIIKIY